MWTGGTTTTTVRAVTVGSAAGTSQPGNYGSHSVLTHTHNTHKAPRRHTQTHEKCLVHHACTRATRVFHFPPRPRHSPPHSALPSPLACAARLYGHLPITSSHSTFLPIPPLLAPKKNKITTKIRTMYCVSRLGRLATSNGTLSSSQAWAVIAPCSMLRGSCCAAISQPTTPQQPTTATTVRDKT